MSFSIKKLQSGDLALAKQLFLFFQADDGVACPVLPSDEYLHTLLGKDSFHVIVAIEHGMVAGGLTAYELDMYGGAKEMFLYEIAVDNASRRNGIATSLIQALKEICAAKDIKIMFVGTSTDNDAAIRLYKTTGGYMEEIPWFTYTLSA